MHHSSSINPNLMLLLPFDVTLIIRVYVVLVAQQIAQTVTVPLNSIIHARKTVPYRNKDRAVLITSS